METRGKAAGLILLIVILCASVAGAEAVRLQYRPEIGKKQTMRMTSRLSTTHPTSAGPDCTEHTWIITAELEPLSVAAGGSVTVRVRMLRAQYEASLGRTNPGPRLDSEEERYRLDKWQGALVAFLGESFTIVVSARGELLELNTDDFYRAIVAKRIEHEDESMRHDAEMRGARRYKDKDERTRRRLIQADAQMAIRAWNEKYGSRQEREQACKNEAPESWYYGTTALRLLFNTILTSFGAEPVQPGDQWTGPVLLRIEEPMELAGAYTFKGVENGVCTIEVQASRSANDRPAGRQGVPESRRAILKGTYQATIKVDQATGAVLSREAVMELKGTVPKPGARRGRPGDPVPVTTTATITVEALP